jgi:hypothetical protein
MRCFPSLTHPAGAVVGRPPRCGSGPLPSGREERQSRLPASSPSASSSWPSPTTPVTGIWRLPLSVPARCDAAAKPRSRRVARTAATS